MNNQHYGLITSIDEYIELHDSAPPYGIEEDTHHAEDTFIWRAIFWTLIVSVAVVSIVAAFYDELFYAIQIGWVRL